MLILVSSTQKFNSTQLDYGTVEQTILHLKQQHKVVAGKVLQHILDQRTACDAQFQHICDTQTALNATLSDCRRARSDLRHARQQLTTNSLQILAAYKKRETLHSLLGTLQMVRRLRDAELRLQQLLAARNYSGAIAVLLECRRLAAEHGEFRCVGVLAEKLKDTLMLAELQLDEALGECCAQHFVAERYGQLQRAYRLLGKQRAACDQLHMCFVSAIHGGAFAVLRRFVATAATTEEAEQRHMKMLFEELCDAVPAEKYTQCCIELCKAFWNVLVCYYQASVWHQNERLFEAKDGATESPSNEEDDAYIAQKFKHGQLRLWTDIQSKCGTLLGSRQLHTLKYEQFIQVLSIVQRLRKVGTEFCGDASAQLMEATRAQSMRFFQRYHAASLEEICLFVDNESWMPVASFTHVQQLQEFRSMRAALRRHQNNTVETPAPEPPQQQQQQQPASLHSQEDGAASSIYGSCGYFYSFAEKSSPFDGGFDDTMLEEDILAGIADESSCYFSEDSDEETTTTTTKLTTAATPTQATAAAAAVAPAVIVNNASLNVLRCIGRYLQMCRLLHSISPNIVASMTELIDFYTFVVHDVFGSDLVRVL